ncbi:DUF4365 domain-containing protein [Actinomycetospora termitidis]|uniref:DUF4365 domain-containing protein n=1 Tax=Actinomycetospora termitidis TaxID=3053470 RepID=A0ABT7MIV2_9PSEU|nr:DUF4365 domain-containing protein [Actinomycetospora sp. Odt1-22]MDL5159268.1 DUF4365 domain-containing protein [Actinomycetospora sp. Odt1-22]
MLDANQHRGSYGEAYLRVLAAAAGLTVYTDSVDRDGIDLGIRMPNPGRGFARAIEVQVKTTASPTWRGSELVFDGLDRRTFNRLAGGDFQIERYLVVAVVPRDADRYSDLYTSGLLLRTIAYFHSLRDQRPLDDGARGSLRTKLSTANVLTAASLRELVLRDPVMAR